MHLPQLLFGFLFVSTAWSSELFQQLTINIDKKDIHIFKNIQKVDARFFKEKEVDVINLKFNDERLLGESNPKKNYDYGLLFVDGYYVARLIKGFGGWTVPDLTRVEFDFSNVRFTKEEIANHKYVGIRSKGDNGNFFFSWSSESVSAKCIFLMQSGVSLGFFVFDVDQKSPAVDFMQVKIPIDDMTIYYAISGSTKDSFSVKKVLYN